MMTKAEETREIKSALAKAGYRVRVRHTGSRLNLCVTIPKPEACYCATSLSGRCRTCQACLWAAHDRAATVAKVVAGRNDDASGELNISIVFAQGVKKEAQAAEDKARAAIGEQ